MDILGLWNYTVQPQNGWKCGDSDMHVKTQDRSNFGGNQGMGRGREKGSLWVWSLREIRIRNPIKKLLK